MLSGTQSRMKLILGVHPHKGVPLRGGAEGEPPCTRKMCLVLSKIVLRVKRVCGTFSPDVSARHKGKVESSRFGLPGAHLNAPRTV